VVTLVMMNGCPLHHTIGCGVGAGSVCIKNVPPGACGGNAAACVDGISCGG
jgi:hypothetical protein